MVRCLFPPVLCRWYLHAVSGQSTRVGYHPCPVALSPLRNFPYGGGCHNNESSHPAIWEDIQIQCTGSLLFSTVLRLFNSCNHPASLNEYSPYSASRHRLPLRCSRRWRDFRDLPRSCQYDGGTTSSRSSAGYGGGGTRRSGHCFRVPAVERLDSKLDGSLPVPGVVQLSAVPPRSQSHNWLYSRSSIPSWVPLRTRPANISTRSCFCLHSRIGIGEWWVSSR